MGQGSKRRQRKQSHREINQHRSPNNQDKSMQRKPVVKMQNQIPTRQLQNPVPDIPTRSSQPSQGKSLKPQSADVQSGGNTRERERKK
ncbi:hypothetical protein POX_c04175 [Penicillium oxalicum]|uniref:hypothetical protein n=1 Tax=Penicillium oxalicum TaxID=69781 RepID=UPI0020B8EECC|nr:hypothetical protein POX_c04175 [Penicillium oxalicum]KAI2791318.1 hypothetical protein POX_c04175 [Penicillium oxalicum]